MVSVNILYFGAILDITGCSGETISGPATLEGILDELRKKYPAINEIRFQVSLNRKLIQNQGNEIPNPIPRDGDEIALLPPFSGG